MNSIALVCSAHRQNGRCNDDELLAILRAIEPDTVFEEVRPSDFDGYRRQQRSVEARAMASFVSGRNVRRVPVDAYEVPDALQAEIRRDFDRVFDFVEESSGEYRELSERNDRAIHDIGFGYLNGPACTALMNRLCEIEDRWIQLSNDAGLITALQTWRRLHREREEAMVRQILEYCGANAGEVGVLLVGVAHKAAIIRAVERTRSEGLAPIAWKFNF